ncbi:hypothetical protein CYY_007683 [Polysphondylium violaceum]|uniref:EGF-like domain-containing protein n=1 Tax=Polysphondylium violaceum TaxID=133409 RepID=A0A8J4PPD8_9MYCE|nr:hypothetical protein CYY_007683 [Polysphondylium violaceum]
MMNNTRIILYLGLWLCLLATFCHCQKKTPTVLKSFDVKSSQSKTQCTFKILFFLQLNGFDIQEYQLRNSTHSLTQKDFSILLSTSQQLSVTFLDSSNNEITINVDRTLSCNAPSFPLEMVHPISYAPLYQYDYITYLQYKFKRVKEGTTSLVKESNFYLTTPQDQYITSVLDPSIIKNTNGDTNLIYTVTDILNRSTTFTIPTFLQDYQLPGQVKNISFYPSSNLLKHGSTPVITMEIQGNLVIAPAKIQVDGFRSPSEMFYLYPVSRLMGKIQYIRAFENNFNSSVTIGIFNSPLSTKTKIWKMKESEEMSFSKDYLSYTIINEQKSLVCINFKLDELKNRKENIYYSNSNNGTNLPNRYGIGKGTELSYQFTVSTLASYINFVQISLGGVQFPSSSLSLPLQKDTIKPSVIDIVVERLPLNQILLKIHATDDLSGVSYLEFFQTNTIMSIANLVSGTPLNGIFETRVSTNLVTNSVGLMVCDKSRNCLYINNVFSLPFYSLEKLVPSIPDYDDELTLTHFSFQYNYLDISKFGSFNTVYLNSTNVNIHSVPIISIQLSKGLGSFSESSDILDYVMEWDKEIKVFKKTFYVPPRLFQGTIDYLIFYKTQFISSAQIYQQFKESSVLQVFSEIPDEMPPIVSKVQFNPSSLILNSDQVVTVTLVVDIEDPINGLDFGSITIGSEFDSFIGYTFNFKPSDAINKDPFYGTYQFQFNINGNCRSQTYSIKSISLQDTSGHKSNTDGKIINPLFKLYDSNSLSLPVKCNIKLDSIPPILKSIQLSKTSFNNNNVQREFNIKLTTHDDNSGISLRHNPIVFIEADNNGLVEVEMKLDSYDSNSKTANYFATSALPFNFGSDAGLLISIYGIYDNHLNTNGYSAQDLRDSGLLSFINTTFVQGPVLESSNPLSSLGGELYLFGQNLQGNNVFAMIDYLDGKGYQTTTLFSKHTGSSLSIAGVIPKSKSLFVKLSSNGILSNELLVIPVPSLDDNVNYCYGNPICGGSERGYCASKQVGCVCFTPYSGPACENKNANNTNTIDPDRPDIDSEFDIFKYQIQVVRVDEMDLNSKVLKSHPLSNWVFKNVSTTTRKEYQYSTSIKSNDITTPIDINIIFFDKLEQVIFANNEYYMSPNSVKYIISLGSYSFSSSLNTLQLVMSVNFTLDSNDTCSSTSFGNSSLTSEYVKLAVNDGYLYSRFVKLGIIDKRIQSIINHVIPNDDQEKNSTNAFSQIGIRIPYFQKSVLLDPDFSVLIGGSAKNEDNSFCGGKKDGNTKHNGTKLSTGAIVGIVVGCVGLAIIVTLSILIYSKRRSLRVTVINLKNMAKKETPK